MYTFDDWLLSLLLARNIIPQDKAEQIRQHATQSSVAELLIHQGYLSQEQLQSLQKKYQRQQKASAQDTLVSQNQSHEVSPQQMAKADEKTQFTSTIGRYQILKKIGQGCFGHVFLVNDPNWNRQLALKVLLSGKLSEEANVKRFRREAQAISQLHHKNIVKVYEVGQEKGHDYFTMDYIEGRSLGDILKQETKIAPRRAARIMSKIARAVHYAHCQNIVHRDIKPSNIMIDENNEPFLTDFGLARAIRGGSKLSYTGSIVGTPAYMPPEQVAGKNSDIDERSDVYGIGATMYKLITGQTLFPGENVMKVLMQVTSRRPTPPREVNPNIPTDLEKICLLCIEKSKEDRYPNAQMLAEDLERFLEGNSVKISDNKWRKLIQRSKVAIAAGTIFILLGGLLSYIIWGLHRDLEFSQQKEDYWKQQFLALEQQIDEVQQQKNSIQDQHSHLKTQLQELEQTNARLREQMKQLLDNNNRIDNNRNNNANQRNWMGNWGRRQSQNWWRNNKSWQDYMIRLIVGMEKFPSDAQIVSRADQEFLELAKTSNSDVYLLWAKVNFIFYRESRKEHFITKTIEILETAIKQDPKNYRAVIQAIHYTSFLPLETMLPKIKSLLAYLPQEKWYQDFVRSEEMLIQVLQSRDRGAMLLIQQRFAILHQLRSNPLYKREMYTHLGSSYYFVNPQTSQQYLKEIGDYPTSEIIFQIVEEYMNAGIKGRPNDEKMWYWCHQIENSQEFRKYLSQSKAFSSWKTLFPEQAKKLEEILK